MAHQHFTLPDQLYHTYIIGGDPMLSAPIVRDFLIRRGDIASQNSGEMLYQIYDSLSVDDSTFLKGWHSEGNVSEGKRICIIGAKAINREAENALLKMFEEPKEGTHFFMIVPEPEILTQTILSRAHVMRMDSETKNDNTRARTFLKAVPAERFVIIENLIKSHKDDETSGGVRYEALQLLCDVEHIVYEEKFLKNKNDVHTHKLLEEIGMLRGYLGLPGSSVKMILEHFALIAPGH